MVAGPVQTDLDGSLVIHNGTFTAPTMVGNSMAAAVLSVTNQLIVAGPTGGCSFQLPVFCTSGFTGATGNFANLNVSNIAVNGSQNLQNFQSLTTCNNLAVYGPTLPT